MGRQYDPAYKLEVCKAIEMGSSTVMEFSREAGIPETTLRKWLQRYRENQETPFVGSGHILPENEEMVRLRRENRDLREEVEILKKAAGVTTSAYYAWDKRPETKRSKRRRRITEENAGYLFCSSTNSGGNKDCKDAHNAGSGGGKTYRIFNHAGKRLAFKGGEEV